MPSMFEITVPALLRGLGILTSYVTIAADHANNTEAREEDLVSARLASDMLTFAGQVQRASDNAKNGVARLIAEAAPSFADDEKTFDDLLMRILKTEEYLSGVTPSDFDGAAEREVELRFKSVTGKMTGERYLAKFLLPNFYFHIATAHGILRNQGLGIGKRDYLGGLD